MMDRNFKIRTIVTIGMLIVAIASLCVFEGLPFKILLALFLVVAGVELFSFCKKKIALINYVLLIIELLLLIGCAMYVFNTHIYYYAYLIVGVPGYDIFAYLFGKAFGGRISKNSRPFPKISKNKTWEGTIFGLAMSLALVTIMLVIREAPSADYIYLLCGPLALVGDLYESWLKRRFDIKDSNEIVIKNPVFKKLEYVVGGSDGHGGFLDRIDSVAFTTTILLIITKWII